MYRKQKRRHKSDEGAIRQGAQYVAQSQKQQHYNAGMQEQIEKVVTERLVASGNPIQCQGGEGHRTKNVADGVGVEKQPQRVCGDLWIPPYIQLIVQGEAVRERGGV